MNPLYTLFLLISVPALADVTARFDRTQIPFGQSTNLIISATEEGTPNLNGLSKDFKILSQSTNQSAQWINGKTIRQNDYVYTLFPKKSGTIHIDALTFNGEKIAPLSLSVVKNSNISSADSPIRMTAKVIPDTLYEGGSFSYVVRLTEDNVILAGQIYPPEIENATIEQVSPDAQFSEQQNGKRVPVFERTFIITPHQSGTQQIEPAYFMGTVSGIQNNDSGIVRNTKYPTLQQMPARTFVQANPLTLTVKSKPKNETGWWLPSTHVRLDWLDVPPSGNVGDPVTLTLLLSVYNMDAANIPAPTMPQTEQFKTYPEEAVRFNTFDNNQLVGQLTQKITFIPLRAGTIELPSPTVTWFNIQTEKNEQAVAPTISLAITGTSVIPNTVQPAKLPLIQSETSTNIEPITPKEPVNWTKWGTIFLLASLILTGILFLGLIVLKIRRGKKKLPDLYPF